MGSQWHSPRTFIKWVKQFLSDASNDKGMCTTHITVRSFSHHRLDEDICCDPYYYIVDGTHRASFLLAMLAGPDEDIQVSVVDEGTIKPIDDMFRMVQVQSTLVSFNSSNDEYSVCTYRIISI